MDPNIRKYVLIGCAVLVTIVVIELMVRGWIYQRSKRAAAQATATSEAPSRQDSVSQKTRSEASAQMMPAGPVESDDLDLSA